MSYENIPGTPALMRSINDRAALSILLKRQPLSRNQLSVYADVSKPTASQMVRRLENAGYIEVVSLETGGRGPNTALYGVLADRILGVAVDVQTDEMLSTIVDAVGTSYPTAVVARETEQSCVTETQAAVAAACQAAGARPESVVAVSIGLQASVATHTDQLVLPTALDGWPRLGARAMLRRETGWSVTLSNDVNLVAAAERATGSGVGTDSFALLWLGRGLGFAADIEGRLLLGARGAAGEIGTLELPAGSSAPTGAAGRLDDLFARDAVLALARRHGLPATSFASLLEILDKASANPAVSQGGGESTGRGSFLAELASRVAVAVPAAVALLDPEVVILGGPLGVAGGTRLARLVTQAVGQRGGDVPLILPASIRQNPVLAGLRGTLADDIRTRLLDEAGAINSAGHREETA